MNNDGCIATGLSAVLAQLPKPISKNNERKVRAYLDAHPNAVVSIESNAPNIPDGCMEINFRLPSKAHETVGAGVISLLEELDEALIEAFEQISEYDELADVRALLLDCSDDDLKRLGVQRIRESRLRRVA